MPYYENLTTLITQHLEAANPTAIPLAIQYFSNQDEMVEWYYDHPSRLWGGM